MRLIVRRLVLNIAMSLDGFIARKDGSYDWIEGHGTDKYDTVLQFDNQKFFREWERTQPFIEEFVFPPPHS